LVKGPDGDSAADARCLWRAGTAWRPGMPALTGQEVGAVSAAACGVVCRCPHR
jgi:hypothetical protein